MTSLGKLIYTEEFVRDGKHYHRSVFAPLMVRVNSDFAWIGTDARVFAGNEYAAQHATNQPDWKEKGKVFIYPDGYDHGFLLEAGDYQFVEWKGGGR